MDNPLTSLKDIEGVYGSFFVDHEGRLLVRDVPQVVSNSALEEAGPRIARLWAALPEDDPPKGVLIEFASHRLFLRYCEVGSLCVFAPPGVNQLALEMAANFVARSLVQQVRALQARAPESQGSPPDPSPPPSSPPASKPSSSAKPRTVVYRGTRYTL